MNLDHNLLEKIDLYTKGQLSPKEHHNFELEINSNDQLRNQVELSQLVDELVVASETLKLKEQMQKDLFKPKSNLGTYLGATIIAISIGSIWLYFNTNKPKEANLVSPSIKNNVPNQIIPNNTNLSPNNSAEKYNTPELKVENASINKGIVQNNISIDTIKNITTHKNGNPTNITTKNSNEETAKTAETSNSVEIKNIQQLNPCQTLIHNVQFTALPSCKGESTGEILIHSETVKGGTPPYSFELNHHQSADKFEHLSAGYYDLFIKDAGSCVVKNSTKVYVPEKNCKINKEFTFNPEYDNHWQIPYDKDKVPLNFKIHDKGGRDVYKTQIISHEPSEWNGQSNTGLHINNDLYFYSIEYTDHSTDEGTIMISK